MKRSDWILSPNPMESFLNKTRHSETRCRVFVIPWNRRHCQKKGNAHFWLDDPHQLLMIYLLRHICDICLLIVSVIQFSIIESNPKSLQIFGSCQVCVTRQPVFWKQAPLYPLCLNVVNLVLCLRLDDIHTDRRTHAWSIFQIPFVVNSCYLGELFQILVFGLMPRKFLDICS